MSVAAFVVTTLALLVAAPAVPLKNTTSPDGRYSLALLPTPEATDGNPANLEVIDTSNGRSVGSFEIYIYDPVPRNDSAEALWRPDSRAFGVMSAKSSFAVYVLAGSKWVEVPIPRAKTKYTAANGWQFHSHQFCVATAWLPDDILKLHTNPDAYRFDASGHYLAAPELFVYLRLSNENGSPKFTVVKVEEKAGS